MLLSHYLSRMKYDIPLGNWNNNNDIFLCHIFTKRVSVIIHIRLQKSNMIRLNNLYTSIRTVESISFNYLDPNS